MAGRATFRPERSDYVAVARGSFLRSLGQRRFRLRMLVAFVVATAIGAAVGFAETGGWRWQSIALACVAMACWLAAIMTGCWLLIPRRSGRLFAQQRSLQHDFTVGWDEEGITQHWSAGTVRNGWGDYTGWFENRQVLAFGLNDQLYHFVPKRVLDEEALADLRRCAGAIAAEARAA